MSYDERKTYNRLEKEIEKLEKKKEELHTRMAVLVNDYEAISKLSKEAQAISESIDEKSMLWLELSERI